jgi:hypothetical protein
MNNTLDIIAREEGTDKSSKTHNYCVKYEKYLPFNSASELQILEIGVLDGESLNMWSRFYYNSKVLGIDINLDCKKFESHKINVEIGNQIDVNFLDYISKKYGPFDLIVDDGSHMNSHVIFSFENLFKHVKSQGVYVVEDSCTSYWGPYEGGLNKSTTMIEYFKRLCDDVNFYGVINEGDNAFFRREDLLIETAKKNDFVCRFDIESITFLNSIIIITKR